jgi:NAD(P)-dependent dehydrogenase (short-subunit alcohol dehydrogenase family)
MPTVLITGANRGIGLALAHQYAADGWRVIATARKPAEARELSSLSGDVRVEALEVTDYKAVRSLAQTLEGEPVDVLFNNAGIGGSSTARFGQIDAADMERIMAVNTIAPILIAEAFVDHVARSGQRKMAFVSSRLGSITSNGGGRYGYGPSKAALNMACKAMSVDLRGRGIIVLPMHPGHVATDMGGRGAPVSPDESAKGMRAVVAAATLGESGKFVDYRGQSIPW